MREINGIFIPDYDFNGKVAVVTGGGSGIGRAIAVQLAACGAMVAVAGIPPKDCDSVRDEISAFGGKAISAPADVSDEAQTEAMLDRVLHEWGRLDIFISNAGTGGEVLPLLEQSVEEFDRVQAVNLRGVFLCGKAAARRMIALGNGGRIINTCSIAYLEGGGNHGPYAAAKGGVSSLTRVMASEWAQHGISVNAVAPGLTRTPINESLSLNREIFDNLISKIPLRRMAQPAEIASLMLYLASDAAAFITGTTIIADGGATIGG